MLIIIYKYLLYIHFHWIFKVVEIISFIMAFVLVLSVCARTVLCTGEFVMLGGQAVQGGQLVATTMSLRAGCMGRSRLPDYIIILSNQLDTNSYISILYTAKITAIEAKAY